MKSRSVLVWLILLVETTGIACYAAHAKSRSYSERTAEAALARWPDGSFDADKTHRVWNYELGTLLEGIDVVWLNTADPRYFNYIKTSIDQLISPDGSIPSWKVEEYQLDNILLGRQLLLLYGVTRNPRYAEAATLLYQQLMHQPRNESGGFWHKQRYPNQMWLDGLYMAEPFYAEYASMFNHPEAFDDITRQFALLDEHARDSKTGLLYHGWDESKQQSWADKNTGLSSQFWARGMGWQMMALVDTLSFYPEKDAGRARLISELKRDAVAVARYQDKKTGLWYQVLDKAETRGNFPEASASCMYVYSLAKGVRKGYLSTQYLANAERGYKGILTRFVDTNRDGLVSLKGTVKGVGLGGNPYRDGSYAYYISEKTAIDDPKGVGAFLLASVEMDNVANVRLGRGKTVLLDAWFNSQQRIDAFGQSVYFHYKWNDMSDSGYSLFGNIFNNFGARTKTLYTAPTLDLLRPVQVYIIVSPDIPAKNPKPNYMQPEQAEEIAKWVGSGGVLMLMENDPGNADLQHLNLLAEHFGIHFNNVLRNQVDGNKFEMGKIEIEGKGPIFHDHHTAYMKEICTLSIKSPAVSRLRDHGDILMATAKYGRGTVFATVDPWLYNEYTDGRKLPAGYDNFFAGESLVSWILAQIPR